MEKCAYCETEMPTIGYVAVLERHEDWTKNITAHGHKRCMIMLKWAYGKHGKVMTRKDVDALSFDPMI